MKNKRFALIGECAPEIIRKKLEGFGYDVIVFPKNDDLEAPVASHVDMLLCTLEDKIFCGKAYYEKAKAKFDILEDSGFEIIRTDDAPRSPYPHDVAFNVALCGKILVANTRYLSRQVTEFTDKLGYELCHAKQGYAKCSTVTVGDLGIITADKGICNAISQKNIPSLLISEGNIVLEGYDHGFIGGASGFDGKALYFTGDIKHHPDRKKIEDFCTSLGNVEIVALTDGPLTDIGSILFV